METVTKTALELRKGDTIVKDCIGRDIADVVVSVTDLSKYDSPNLRVMVDRGKRRNSWLIRRDVLLVVEPKTTAADVRIPREERFVVGDRARVVNKRYETCGTTGDVVAVNYRSAYEPVVEIRRGDGQVFDFLHHDLERVA
jgi:hypothetical protein